VASARESELNPLIRRLESIFALSAEERGALLRLPVHIAELKADQDIVRERDRPSRCCLVLQGFACSYKLTADGKRQIMAFWIEGDVPDMQSLHLHTLDHSLGTITPCKVAFIDHEPLRVLCDSYPRLAGAFWRDTLIEAAVFREWMVSIGRRAAFARVAHLFCEILVRLRAIGRVDDHVCDLPLTQTEIADALGLTTVHVNRTIRDLREAGLAVLKGGVLTVPDWEKLKQAGEFDPIYLHLKTDQAAA
jgi:CRP-like cAMP-binding protein